MQKTNFSSLSSRFLNIIAIVAMLLAALPVSPAYAASITVTNTSDDLTSSNGCSLREAIINANNDSATYPDCAAGTGMDTIVLQSGSTYTLSLVGAGSTAGDLDITDADGLIIQANGATRAIIDANDIDRVLDTTAASGPLTLNRITLTNGNAVSPATGGGIAHGSTATLTVTNSTISSNIATSTAGCGAGIYNNNSAAIIISNSTIEGNDCSVPAADGGGLWKGNSGSVEITNSTFYNNSAIDDGGGMRVIAGTVAIKNSTFANNTAGNRGGAIQVSGATVTIDFSTFSGNTANGAGDNNGGALQVNNGSAVVTASILANSTAGQDCDKSGTGTATLTNTLVESNVDCSTVSVIISDPALSPLASNGGPTQTMAINQSSPAYNAASSCGSTTTDQRGITRPQFGACDLGAYEFPDTTGPSVSSIVRAGSNNPTGAASVNFTVTFSESVTGVGSADFSTTTTGGITGESVTGVSGSGTTYTVTVNTGSGNGTLRLDVVDDDSIQDTSNNPLGGVGAGNGDFTSGQVYTISKGSLNSDQTSIDFGDQLYYTKSDPTTVTLTNDQVTDVHMGSFQRSSGQFILSNNNCVGATLTPAQSCTFDLQFKPTAYGALSGTLTINSDAANGPVVISLDAVGLPGTQLVTKGGSFEQDNNNDTIPDNWDTTGLTGLDGRSNQYAKHGTYSMKIVGQSGMTKTLKQTIVQNGSAGDDFLYVLWSKALNVPGGFKYRTQVSFYNGTSLVERRIKDYTAGTHDWEYRWLPITVSGDYTRIEVEIIYSLPSGTVWFDSDSLKWAP